MSIYRVTDATVEPVSLAEMKEYLRLESGADPVAAMQSIVPNNWPVAAAYSNEGAYIDTLGYTCTVCLDSGTNAAGATVDAKIQTSTTGAGAGTDWTGGGFTPVTTANDNAVQEITYTGSARYIRVVATVAVDTCDFAAYVIRQSRLTTEDTLLGNYIKAARQYAEIFTARAFINQTWRMKMDNWPASEIILPWSPLSTVTSIYYVNTSGVSTEFAAANYTADTDREPGRVTLAYGCVWPSDLRDIANAITTTYVSGYGATSASVPEEARLAIRMLAAHWYENREPVNIGNLTTPLPMSVGSLLWQLKVPEIG